ncbi:MAG: homogentisate 1,2-dioxygenase [Flavobacteriales bacterium]|nr:homogentisate 1,2-dioxygenase [Flavobacteriales bacterium]MBP9080448.1 homogentisate 1,2-dioxygenase [Flavobacteriales bacterium]
MPIYHTLGNIPHKRHTVFNKPGGGYYYEQLFGTEGFSGMSSLLYHTHRPTQVKKLVSDRDIAPKIAIAKNMRALRLKGFDVKPEADHIAARKTILVNNDCAVILAAPTAKKVDYFYKNTDCDEMIFIHKGTGRLRSTFGTLDFKYGDYLLVPRGIIFTLEFDTADNRLLIVESRHPMYTPNRYRNEFGQLLEHSPFCERDIRRPHGLETHDEKGDFRMFVKKQDVLHEMIYATHPFDVVGWDGYNYPYAFSIHDFEPITGRVHLPPPIHQTFQTSAMVICSFCPRLYDYHPQAIPAPYNHSNIDSDELLYYVAGDFMSRNDIGEGNLTLHPAGIVHGPQPGAMERSIGKKETNELAVMVDTFKPLQVTEEALKIDDGKYWESWLE